MGDNCAGIGVSFVFCLTVLVFFLFLIVGPVYPVKQALPKIVMASELKRLGKQMKNCGLKKTCEEGTFPVMVHSGKRDKRPPKICVDSRMYVTSQLVINIKDTIEVNLNSYFSFTVPIDHKQLNFKMNFTDMGNLGSV